LEEAMNLSRDRQILEQHWKFCVMIIRLAFTWISYWGRRSLSNWVCYYIHTIQRIYKTTYNGADVIPVCRVIKMIRSGSFIKYYMSLYETKLNCVRC
jgi:hypothetical protein